MATRNGVPLDIVWIHVRVGPPGPTLVEQELIDYLDAQQDLYPGLTSAMISILHNIADTEWLAKCPNATVGFINSSPGWVKNKVITIYEEADHAALLALIKGPEWPDSLP